MNSRDNAFTDNGETGITGAMIRFVALLRKNGFQAGTEETLNALNLCKTGLLREKTFLLYGLRSLFCTSEEEYFAFGQIFEQFWIKEKELKPIPGKKTVRNAEHLRNPQGSLVMVGTHSGMEGKEGSKSVTGANAMEKLQHTDFSLISQIDSKLLESVADQLWLQMARKLKRRMKNLARKEQVNLRRTIRKNIPSGGDLISLQFKSRKRRKPKLIVLLDVSGSMDKYSFFLLRFIWALQGTFSSVETFIFSTRILRITEILKNKGLEETLEKLGREADNWSGGTRIGECLNIFNQKFAPRFMNGYTYTLVLSDGLDTGTPEQLKMELKKLRLKTSKLIWLNPLKGSKEYQPSARGMAAALPYIDEFRSAHNLKSLMELEQTFAYV